MPETTPAKPTKPAAAAAAGAAAHAKHASVEASIIDTLQSILIAFILAFVFRSFVIEAFVIPTGSMAPTLRGAHLEARSPNTGYAFAVGPRDKNADNIAAPIQGTPAGGGPIVVPDPMLDPIPPTGRPTPGTEPIRFSNAPTRMGDRILVLKYLYRFFPPERFDVIVFKNPTDPAQNYIKRLVGLPGERPWLCDGDVFSAPGDGDGLDGFAIRRKPEHVQRAVWQPVYHSDHIPLQPERILPAWSSPWQGDGWQTEDRRAYRTESARPTVLRFDQRVRQLNDAYPYNTSEPRAQSQFFPVADLRVQAGFQPDAEGLETAFRIEARQHAFEARLDAASNRAELRMKPIDAPDGDETGWTTLDVAEGLDFGRPGDVTDVEFWHVDQALWLFVEGSLVARGEYEWDAVQRSILATGLDPADVVDDYERTLDRNGSASNQYRFERHAPQEPRLTMRFAGSPLTLHRVRVDRDLHYQPTDRPADDRRSVTAARATHPAEIPVLGPDHFFVCGDNSASSLDSRLLGAPEPWIAHDIESQPGVIHRDLLMGKAFFVYFPAPEGIVGDAWRWVPNFGQMRFIH